jgi:prepilin-type N-terminal cleavage/methylation domain-containing protein
MVHNQKGFTLVELMAATVITVLFAGALYGVFSAMRDEMWRQNIYYDTNRAVRHGLELVSRDVKEALRIEPAWGGDTTANTVLILRLPSIDNNGEPTNINSQFDYVTYKLDSADPTKLVRSLDVLGGVSAREGGTDKTGSLVAKKIQTLLFSSGGTGLSSLSASQISGIKILSIQILGQGSTLGVSQTTQGESDVMLRNQIL